MAVLFDGVAQRGNGGFQLLDFIGGIAQRANDEATAVAHGIVGQETVAKVANAGHPTRVVRAVAVEGPASPGDAVIADGVSVGVLTSVAVDGAGRSRAIVRVRWDARSADLRTASGAAVSPA